MLNLFFFRFWPVLVPLLVYWLWHRRAVRKAAATGASVPHFADGPWYWAVLASLLTGMACFILIGSDIHEDKGEYIPPHMENGTLVPGQVAPLHE